MRVVFRTDSFFRRLWRQSRAQGHLAFPADFVALVDPLYEEAEAERSREGNNPSGLGALLPKSTEHAR